MEPLHALGIADRRQVYALIPVQQLVAVGVELAALLAAESNAR